MGVILCVFFTGCLRIAVVGTRVRDSGSAAPGGVSGMGGGEPLVLSRRPEPHPGGCVRPGSGVRCGGVGLGLAACRP